MVVVCATWAGSLSNDPGNLAQRAPHANLLGRFSRGEAQRKETVAVRLRLTRVGGKKDPRWRVVVADSRSPRDGRVIETIGHYNAQTDPSTIVIDAERARAWLARGAQPSDTVRKLLRTQGIEVGS
jgi:small subunit ribosomal protein S16